MRRKTQIAAVISVMLLATLSLLGAMPQQSGVPPQPYYADFYSGEVILRSKPAPPGVWLVACVEQCNLFETGRMALDADGTYRMLAVRPQNRRLTGGEVTFFIVNEYGRIKAAETTYFDGGFISRQLDLHFTDPLPLPPPLPTLPAVGDPIIPYIPLLALGLGAAALAGGLFIMMLSRRRAY